MASVTSTAIAALTDATGAYRAEQDSVGTFIAERCRMGQGLSVGATSLFESFQQWARETGHQELTQTQFGRRLTDLGFNDGKHPVTRRVIRCGLTIDQEPQNVP